MSWLFNPETVLAISALVSFHILILAIAPASIDVRRKRITISDHENTERWLLTYADLITLLLAFFIVMYSMSRMDNRNFSEVLQALNGVLRGGEKAIEKEFLDNSPGHGLLKLGNLRMIERQLQARFGQLNQLSEIHTEMTERGLVIHIMESALFEESSAKLEPRALGILDIVSTELEPLPNHIRIEGHTDDRQINTRNFPSNWELSSVRATEVVRYLIDSHAIDPGRISALGYGEYRPIRPNSSVENRAANRRVDIVVLTMELTIKEPTSQLYLANKSR